MKLSFSLRTFAALVTLCWGLHASAQTSFSFTFGVSQPTNAIVLGDSTTYTITLTNLLSDFGQVYVTNSFNQPVTFLSSSNDFVIGTFTNNATNGVFTLFNVPLSAIINLTLRVQPGTPGSLTNQITVTANTTAVVPASTNIVTTVINPVADLGVKFLVPPAVVMVNDPMTYSIVASNAGPASATGVFLTNSLTGVKLLSVSSSNFTLLNDRMVFALGTLAARGDRTIDLTVQPTNAGILGLASAVASTGIIDTNTANNAATTNVVINSFLPATLTVTNLNDMVLDRQTGRLKQTVRLSNVGTNDAPSVRVMVAGLTNRLSNAVGTNNGTPYVLYAATLSTNSFVDLVLEYWSPSRLVFPVPNSSYTALSVPLVNPTVPGGGTNAFNITSGKWLANGTFLIEFQSVPGASYTVLYSADPNFGSNVFAAQPAVTAPANRTQWIDNGPPKTVSLPTQTPARNYKVQRN
jgi:uncharacterized repeat protein (TIGR01451 family)